MSNARRSLTPDEMRSILSSPQPMWIFDQENLHFLEVNQAAVDKYGYTREEFLEITTLDIRPVEDVPALLRSSLGHPGPAHGSHWRHRKKDGTVFPVEISSEEIVFLDRHAEVVRIVDLAERNAHPIPSAESAAK